MKIIRDLLFISTFLFISCSSNKMRIKGMCQELNINIPSENYTEIKNEVDEAGPDFTINIILKLDKNNLDNLTRQIISSPYFNRPAINGVNSDYTKLLKDINRRGLWKRNNIGFEFVDYGKTSEPVTAYLDTTKQTLEYTFVHL